MSEALALPVFQRARRTQRERSDVARTKLLNAAIDLICERGYAQMTMADVAERAGFTRGAIQHHFEGRDDLVLAIIREAEQQISSSFAAVLPGSGHDVATRVDLLIDSLGAISLGNTYLAVVDIWIATRSHAQLAAQVRESMLRSSQSFKQLWFRVFADDVPAPVIANCRRIVVTIMRGIVISQAVISNARAIQQVLTTCKEMVRYRMAGK